MRKGNLIKMAAPAILSAAMMVSGLPVMAADFTSDTAVETEAQTDEFDAADDTADAFAGDEETPFVDDQAAAEDEFAATAETGYKYVYAGLTWAQYWASEGVYNAANTASNGTKDSHDELDKGGFDTVTRATVNHGLHRGSYQCEAIMYDKNGGSYEISYWTSANDAVLTDGTTVKLNQPERGQITKADGSVVEFDHYNVVGLKYVPVAVKAEDYEAFKSQFKVVEDGSTVAGGFGENNLQSYSAVADVTAETNGLKEAVKGSDGTFTFKARTNGTGSGLKDQALQTASNVTATVKEASGSYGEFLRVDLTGNYGDLGSNLQTVTWTYYGDDSTYTNAKATYGTKFEADNWMHSKQGIQLGLTDSVRCQLPKGTDGTGYWSLTIYALGYEDYTYDFEATKDNIALKSNPASAEEKATLQKLVTEAESFNKDDYCESTAAKAAFDSLLVETSETKDLLNKEDLTSSEATEQVPHITDAINAVKSLKKHDIETITTPATTTKEGSIVEKCKNCGKIISTKTIAKLPATTAKPSATTTVTNTTTIKAPAKTTVKLSKAKKTSIKVSWKKVSGVAAYQIQYSTSKNFKNAKTVKVSAKSASKVLKKLKKNKKYYVRVRSYKVTKVNNKSKNVYSAWSAKKALKTKKK